MMPTPSLFADPSSPRAMYGRSALIRLEVFKTGTSKHLPGVFSGLRFRILPGMLPCVMSALKRKKFGR